MAFDWIAQKRRYRRCKARADALPADYREATGALERYMTYFGPGTGDGVLAMLEDLLDLFEGSVANGTPLRDVVGSDPVDFAEAFLRNYPEGSWIVRERERLNSAIDRAAGEKASA